MPYLLGCGRGARRRLVAVAVGGLPELTLDAASSGRRTCRGNGDTHTWAVGPRRGALGGGRVVVALGRRRGEGRPCGGQFLNAIRFKKQETMAMRECKRMETEAAK
jgi:hypothetical protein